MLPTRASQAATQRPAQVHKGISATSSESGTRPRAVYSQLSRWDQVRQRSTHAGRRRFQAAMLLGCKSMCVIMFELVRARNLGSISGSMSSARGTIATSATTVKAASSRRSLSTKMMAKVSPVSGSVKPNMLERLPSKPVNRTNKLRIASWTVNTSPRDALLLAKVPPRKIALWRSDTCRATCVVNQPSRVGSLTSRAGRRSRLTWWMFHELRFWLPTTGKALTV